MGAVWFLIRAEWGQDTTYLRWSSIIQLASSVAVGLAMFLLAMLFPVFRVACRNEDSTDEGKAHMPAGLRVSQAEHVHTSSGARQPGARAHASFQTRIPSRAFV